MDLAVSLTQLQKDLHEAFKRWHDPASDFSGLRELQLFQQVQRGSASNPRQAIIKILLEALETLAIHHQDSAELLRQHFLEGRLMHTVASRLNIGQSTAYRKQQEAFRQLALIIQTKEAQTHEANRASLQNRLGLPAETHLFGVEAQFDKLLEQLMGTSAPWLISIEGLGGMGKTALANALTRHLALTNRFQDVAWLSAKQQTFFPDLISAETTSPVLTGEILIDTLLEHLGAADVLFQSPQLKRETLIKLLKEAPYLIVIDNLETVVDYQTLLPILREIANPSKILLTSRHSLRTHPGVFCLTLEALDQPDTFLLIRHEAALRGLSFLAEAEDDQLKPIFEAVGGSPLALKLVVGQTAFLPLSDVLENLKIARGRQVSDLYTYIYWQAWQTLGANSRQVLLIMPLTQEGTLAQLHALSRLDLADLHQALQQLITLSLVQAEGGLNERRYSIHRLTETFLIHEAMTWPVLV